MASQEQILLGTEEMVLELEETALELEETANVGIAAEVENGGVILVLFETPSGFALFGYDGVKLNLPDAIKNIWGEFAMKFMKPVWLKDFKSFEDKESLLSQDTGVNKELAEMIVKHIKPGQKLAVGKNEYQTIIERYLRISCMCNDVVMELMWGLSNLMPYLMPDEHSKLAVENFLPICEGMRTVLDRYSFDVKPEMVNRDIIEATGLVYECDFIVKKHERTLHYAGEVLKDISGIEYKDWDLLKLATALMMVCYPNGEKIVAGNLEKLFGDDFPTLVRDAPQYKGKVLERALYRVYEEMFYARKHRHRAVRQLAGLIRRAREAYEAGQA